MQGLAISDMVAYMFTLGWQLFANTFPYAWLVHFACICDLDMEMVNGQQLDCNTGISLSSPYISSIESRPSQAWYEDISANQ